MIVSVVRRDLGRPPFCPEPALRDAFCYVRTQEEPMNRLAHVLASCFTCLLALSACSPAGSEQENRPPTANAGENRLALPGSSVTLDGSESTDPDADALTFSWALIEHPDQSDATLTQSTTANPTLVVDVGGVYVTELTVSDGLLEATDRVRVSVTPEELAPPSFGVDATLEPAVEELPGFEDGVPRPVATIEDDTGSQADFVENELWLVTDDGRVLDDFLARWQGEVIATFDPSDFELTNVRPQYLVRVDVSGAAPDRLPEDVRLADPGSRGDHRVSSERGLKLIAASMREQAAGVMVGINWIGRGAEFRERISTEAPAGDTIGGTTYATNVFGWPSHDSGSAQDIGVAEAWWALEATGRLGNRVDIAVLDMGFAPDADVPSGLVARSNVPLVSALGTQNLIGCGSGNPCLFHGTNVVSAAMALPDNDFGAAGPAGPIAEPIVVFTLYDYFTSATALGLAKLAGAKIANMSYGAPVPASLSGTVAPFETATLAFRASGLLMFASAGNDGTNVDAEDCFIFCWEETLHTPCENLGMICVGGLAWNATTRANNSNFGREQVEIYAPYTLWVGPDPGNPQNRANRIDGTSFSSPFTAGVAALIWAADPSLSADRVERILMQTAHVNPSFPASPVPRWVDAYAAVARALGTDIPPYVKVAEPSQGTSFRGGEGIDFIAEVDDLDTDPSSYTVEWTATDAAGGVQDLGTSASGATLTASLPDPLCAFESTVTATVVANGTPYQDAVSLRQARQTVPLTTDVIGPRIRDVKVERDSGGDPFIPDVTLFANADKPLCDDPSSSRLDQDRHRWFDESSALIAQAQSITLRSTDFESSVGSSFRTRDIEVTYDLGLETAASQVTIKPCSSTVGSDPGSSVSGYPECSLAAVINDVIATMREAFGTISVAGAKAQADRIVGGFYSRDLIDLEYCDPTHCDPPFPDLRAEVISDLYGVHGELAVVALDDLFGALESESLAAFDESLTSIQRKIAQDYENGFVDEDDMRLFANAASLTQALVEFFVPESQGGQNGWRSLNFASDPDTLAGRVEVLRPAYDGLAGYLTGYLHDRQLESDIHLRAAQYAASRTAIEEAARVSD
ncbi:MAG: S8 family serine peptidase [Trueperaceae bacterium]|nr:S8 family serine peptidase [Trueperaceae bacterium]